MKLAFVNKLTELAEADERIYMLTGDLGFQIFDGFIDRHGPRYVNCGVAEANMVDVAAGLAHVGCRPLTYSIASFATARCYEQIKLAVAYEGLPVVVVGAGGGYAYCEAGVTHHAGEDLALMTALPGMTVVAPGDCGEVRQLLPQVLDLDGPAYFRLGRGREPDFHAPAPAVLGKFRLLQDGDRLAVLSTGESGGQLAEALEVLAADGIRPLAYQVHTVKPLDYDALEHIAQRVDAICTLEEHVPVGGLSAAVADWLATRSDGPRATLIPVSAPDEWILGSPHKQQMRRQLGLDPEGIAHRIRRIWQGPAREGNTTWNR